MKNITARSATILLGIVLIISGSAFFAPRTAHAQWIVHDPANFIENTITAIYSGHALTDPLFWALSKSTLQSIVKSTVTWINNGFNGAPGFVTNLNQTLQYTSDATANNFLQQLQTNGSIHSPFQDAVAQQVRAEYLQSSSNGAYFSQNAYTLNQVTPNDAAFLNGETTQGGLDAWFAAVMNPGNTPIGATQLALGELNGQIDNAQNTQLTELNWGQGIMSYRGNCSVQGIASAGRSLTSLSPAVTSCLGAGIRTPGSVILASLNKSFGSGIDTLVSAREFDEIVTSLLSNLITNIAGGGGSLADFGNSISQNQPDAGLQALNSSIGSDFSSAMNSEMTQLQQFQTNWSTINSAAQDAKAALSGVNINSSACMPDAQSVIASTVQPVIDQAAANISKAQTALQTLSQIQSAIPSASNPNASQQIANLNDQYNAFLAANTTPSATDISNAAQQAADTTGTPGASPSLLTQMNNLKQQALSCH